MPAMKGLEADGRRLIGALAEGVARSYGRLTTALD
jgi:hypothetical protein